jgi:hypothetical protein
MLAIGDFERFDKLGGGLHVAVKCLLVQILQQNLDHHPFHFSEKMLLQIESTSGRCPVVTFHISTSRAFKGPKR